MNYEVFITSAVTGSGDTVGKSDKVPVTPKEIAAAAIESAKAGAAIAHCHVRDPETGAPARKLEYYREVVERIRDADEDVVINLTAGMGGDLTLGNVEQPLPPSVEGTDMAGATERMEHVAALLPEICTLDCGTLNFGHGDYVMTNTPSMLRAMAQQMTDLGVRPEIEAFDTGHLWQAKSLADEGLDLPELETVHSYPHELHMGDIFEVLKIVKSDIAYFDPPYGTNNKNLVVSTRYSSFYHLWNQQYPFVFLNLIFHFSQPEDALDFGG